MKPGQVQDTEIRLRRAVRLLVREKLLSVERGMVWLEEIQRRYPKKEEA